MSAGAVAAISALFSASRSDAAIPRTLSSTMRFIARSMPMNAYHATMLAAPVIAAMQINATNSRSLIPSGFRSLATASGGVAVGLRPASVGANSSETWISPGAPELSLSSSELGGPAAADIDYRSSLSTALKLPSA